MTGIYFFLAAFLAGAFLAAVFFAGAFLATVFFAVVFLAARVTSLFLSRES